MNRSQTKARIAAMLSAGERKQAVFDTLSGQGVSDRVLAQQIASHVDPQRCRENRVHRWIVIALAYIQLLFVLVLVAASFAELPPGAALLIGVFGITVSVVFVWGFTKNIARAYSASIMLSAIQLPKQLHGFDKSPGLTLLGIALTIGIVAYLWFVRRRLFPDFSSWSVGKQNGRYVFVD